MQFNESDFNGLLALENYSKHFFLRFWFSIGETIFFFNFKEIYRFLFFFWILFYIHLYLDCAPGSLCSVRCQVASVDHHPNFVCCNLCCAAAVWSVPSWLAQSCLKHHREIHTSLRIQQGPAKKWNKRAEKRVPWVLIENRKIIMKHSKGYTIRTHNTKQQQ